MLMLHAACFPQSCISFSSSPKFTGQRWIPTSARMPTYPPDKYPSKSDGTPWMIVGLGNPRNKFYGTRHNVGFEMIDSISEKETIPLNTIQSNALIGVGSIGEVPVLLVKPQSYISSSGESVGPLAVYYNVSLRHILLVYDEMSVGNSILLLQRQGGDRRHNGLKSVIQHLGDHMSFPRLCIGIGHPPGRMDMRPYVLQKFNPTEREQMDEALRQGPPAVRHLLLNGFDTTIYRFNIKQKYKHHKIEA